MNQLTPAEKAVFDLWRSYVRTKSNFLIRPMLLYYCMVEELIDYYTNQPDGKRPQRPSETALNDIGTTSGALSKWRKKWQKIWFSIR